MMDSQQHTGDMSVRKDDLERCEEILGTLIISSEKHQITDAANTFSGWRKQVQKLKTKLENPAKAKIAVYGNTGMGKSSLLNAIFDQPNLLPTSGMGNACTSVIIKIETVQEDQVETGQEGFQADIIFLTLEEWTTEIDLLKNDLSGDSDDKIHMDARQKLIAIYGQVSLDVLDELDSTIEKRTDINVKLGTTKTTERYSTALELRKEIEDYIIVKEDGQQYWPIVKCVVVRLYNPRVCHQGVVFVDLPGIGDSNPVRVKMADEEKQSARILLVVTKIDRCKASPTVESIIGDEMYRQMKMDNQENILVCTRTDDVDVDGAKRFMNPAEKEAVNKLEKDLSECRKKLKASDPQNQQLGQLFLAEKQLGQELLSKCATVRNDDIKKTLCDNTDTAVFCVSSMDYMKVRKDYTGDNKPPVFVDTEHTEIPKLRAYLEVQAAKTKKQEICDIQGRFHSILSDTYSYICNFQITGKDHMARNVSHELDKMQSKLKTVAKNVDTHTNALYEKELFTMIDDGAAEAKKNADATCLSWGRSTSSVKKALACNTYRAIIVRQGSFKTKTGQHDFNKDLARPLLTKMMVPWEDVFGTQTWDDLINDEAIQPAAKIIEEHALKIQEFLLDEQEEEKLRENLYRIKDDAVFKLQALRPIFLLIVEPAQRAANRVIVSTVQDKMLSTYKLCEDEAGPGSYDRMKLIMEAHVKDLKETIFMESRDALKKQLMEMTMNVCGFIEDVLSHIHEDYLQQLNPLWMETVGQKYLEDLVKASEDISKLLPNISAQRKGNNRQKEMSSSRKRTFPYSSSSHAKKNKTDTCMVRGTINFQSDEEAAAAQRYFNANSDSIKRTFEDQDLEFVGWEKLPEFRVPDDFTTQTIQALTSSDWFTKNANINIHLTQKVIVNVVNSKNVQLGDNCEITQGTTSATKMKGSPAASVFTSSSKGISPEDKAEVTIYSTDEKTLQEIVGVLTKMKKLMESPCLVIDIQKMGSSSVFIKVTRWVMEPCSLYMIVKKIFHSKFLRHLIASDAITVTSNLFPSGVTESTCLRS